MSPEERRALVEKPFPTIQVCCPAIRHCGVNLSHRQDVRHSGVIKMLDTPDDQDYFSNAVQASMSEQERMEHWRQFRNSRTRHIQSCGRVR